MHEFSIATGIVENVLAFADAHPDTVVRKVRILIGELTCVDAEQLSFCYDSITKGTPLDGSELEIDPLAATVQCRHCGYEGPPKYWDDALVSVSIPTLQCPQCSQAAEATRGHECEIKSVQVTREEQAGMPG